MKTKGGREWVVDRGQRLEASYAKTQRVGDEGRDETGTLSAEPWVRGYRMRNYLSSNKLKDVD